MASSSSSSAASSSSVSLQYTPYWVHAAFLCFREEEDDDFVNFIFNKVLPDNNITNYKKTEKTQSIDDLLSILQGCALSIVIFSENFADSTKCLDEVAAIAQSKAQIGNWVLPIFYKMDRSDVTEESGSYATMIDTNPTASGHDKKRWMAALEVVANCLVPTSDQINARISLNQKVCTKKPLASSTSSPPATSSSPSGSLFTGQWEYDVFVCFRGDTRHEFTSFVQPTLTDNQIKTFIDTMLEKTECIDELLSILKRSAISVVIFSKKFADSRWCLDEVAAIAKSMDQFGHRTLPVFYKVDPSDVSGPSGSYAKMIDEKIKPSREDKNRWMVALHKVAKCAGRTSDEIKNDYQLLQAVVGDVRKKLLDMSHSVECNNLVDMDSRISEVEQLLAMDTVADEFGIIGLWGMGGSGKTTLADVCYKKHFNSSRKQEKIKHHFLENINNKCQGRQLGLQGLILELYSELLSDPKLNRQSLAAVNTREHLYNIRVFLVLDDVGSLWQLDELLLGYISTKCTKLFGPGSRIIVTTRDKQVIELGLLGKIYHVKCLNDDTSLQLFTLSAFKQAHPPDDFKDLSLEASRYCNGHPLALKVLGGIFSNNRDKKYWGNILYNLSHREGLARVDNILSESLKELGSRQKGVFLNVACFLCGMLRTRLIHFMKADGYDPYSDIKDLIGKSLLNCVSSKEGEVIEVHDLLRDMAWKNVKEEEPHLKKRSRLENPKDICKLLQVLKGDRATEGISLNLSKAKEDVILKGDAFVGMDSLKWLEFYGPIEGHKVHIESGVIDFLPTELRGLKWDLFPLQYLPAGFYPENLRILTLRNSNVDKCWEGECQSTNLVNLMELDLSGCKNLTILPNLSQSLLLEVLIIRGCQCLVEVPSYVGLFLQRLVTFDLRDCSNLKHIPTKLNSKFLKYVLISKCPNVTHCPEIDYSTELEILDLDHTPIVVQPATSIYNKIKKGGQIRLYGPNITIFPQVSTSLYMMRLTNTLIREIEFHQTTKSDEDFNVPRLKRLDLLDNSKLKRLPSNLWKMVSTQIYIARCPLIKTLPKISDPSEGLVLLAVTGCNGLRRIPSGINNLKALGILSLPRSGIKVLPCSIEDLSHLGCLVLANCKSLDSIPASIHKLAKLTELNVVGCDSLVSLPQLPPSLEVLLASDCSLLQDLPSNLGDLIRCKKMSFHGCLQLSTSSLCQIESNLPDPTTCEGITRSYPGNELPEWLTYQEEEVYMGVRVLLPVTRRLGTSDDWASRFPKSVTPRGILLTVNGTDGVTNGGESRNDDRRRTRS
ncbi:Disease resistance protein RUN1 [Linum perenne]